MQADVLREVGVKALVLAGAPCDEVDLEARREHRERSHPDGGGVVPNEPQVQGHDDRQLVPRRAVPGGAGRRLGRRLGRSRRRLAEEAHVSRLFRRRVLK